jgi:uncharacterized protein (UPF0332 family)/predicted nucleotidyltransferase
MATLAEASLRAEERRTIDRFASRLERGLGADLRGVWLYGSRARGEWTGPESDVDLLVITTDGSEEDKIRAALWETAEAEDISPFLFSLQVYGVDWLAERRAVEAFFVKEVDRDRIVLAGDPGGLAGVSAPAPELLPGEMRPRTKELLEEAHERLEVARLSIGAEIGTPAVSLAYYAAFDAARAALSEEDLHARSHEGAWQLFRETFVLTGRFDAGLYGAARAVQERRENADYRPVRFTFEGARSILGTCDRFVTAVEAMLARQAGSG